MNLTPAPPMNLEALFTILKVILVGLAGVITVASPFLAKAAKAFLDAKKELATSQTALATEQKSKVAAQPVWTIQDITAPIVQQLVDQNSQAAVTQQTMMELLKRTIDQFEARSSQLTELTTQNAKLSHDVDQLRRDLQTSQDCVDDLQQQLAALKRDTSQALDQAKNQYALSLQEIQNQLSTRERELAEARQVIKEQSQQLTRVTELETRIKKLETEVEQLQQDRKQLLAERDEAVADKLRLEAVLSEKEQELASLRAEKEAKILGMQEKVEALQRQIAQQAVTIASLKNPEPPNPFEIVDDAEGGA